MNSSLALLQVDTSCGEIVISVWDTAGQERFDSLTKLYYNGASAALICIDLTDGSSYSKAQFWVRHFSDFARDLQSMQENATSSPMNSHALNALLTNLPLLTSHSLTFISTCRSKN